MGKKILLRSEEEEEKKNEVIILKKLKLKNQLENKNSLVFLESLGSVEEREEERARERWTSETKCLQSSLELLDRDHREQQ